MDRFKEDPANTPQILDLLKLVIIDLIGGYSSSNRKMRL